MLADQSEWAVCGRSAGVVNMETARKQTVVVEVMALVGGHLPLPKVKLSKYIPADICSMYKSASDTSSEPGKQNCDDDNAKAVMKSEKDDNLVATSTSQQNSTGIGKSFYAFILQYYNILPKKMNYFLLSYYFE